MMAFIKQVKKQSSQEKTHHVSETIVVEKPCHSSTAGPVKQSRNNSLAIQETKRGRPLKFVYPKPAALPDYSPPPMKTAPSTHDLTIAGVSRSSRVVVSTMAATVG